MTASGNGVGVSCFVFWLFSLERQQLAKAFDFSLVPPRLAP